jgi:hypothetical protein
MKSLDQIEPRADLQGPSLPPGVTTDANAHFIINQSGSYYLSRNVAVTKTNGIVINTAGVTIDLRGFEISRSSGSGGTGISLTPGASDRATVQNGSIKGFAHGITANSGNLPAGGRFSDLVISACSVTGLDAGTAAVVDGCRFVGNTATNVCLAAHQGSTITNCSAQKNPGTGPAIAGIEATVATCSAVDNGAAGFFAVNSNVTHCTSSFNAGDGFRLSQSRLTDCTGDFNNGEGIVADEECVIVGNTVLHNGWNGILTTIKNNRIDGNHAIGNAGYGIRSASSTADYIMRNTAFSNNGNGAGLNYFPASGTYFGPLTTPGNTSATAWSNFQ